MTVAEWNDKVNRKPFTMIIELRQFNSVMRIEHVKESTTHEGIIYACTGKETYIFPLDNIVYAKLIEEDTKE